MALGGTPALVPKACTRHTELRDAVRFYNASDAAKAKVASFYVEDGYEKPKGCHGWSTGLIDHFSARTGAMRQGNRCRSSSQ